MAAAAILDLVFRPYLGRQWPHFRQIW